MSKHTSLSGIWHNEQGSELALEAYPDGRLAGRFHTGVGFGTDERFDVTGFWSGNLVAFAVNFGKYGSITSWTGHLTGGELETLWHMALELPHPRHPEDLWRTAWTGANTFVRGEAPRVPRDARRGPNPLWTA